MADELNGAESSGDDLRSMLSSAFDAAEAPPPAEAPEPPPAAPQAAADRARDEAGRFARAPAVTDSPTAAAAFEVPKDGQQAAVPPEGAAPAPAAPAGPPPGWSVAAKAAFDTLPPAVREAVAKREEEINKGFQKLADYKGLDPYVEMARQSGQDLGTVIKNYTAAEQLLDQNFEGGIVWLCDRYGVNPQQLAMNLLGGQMPQHQGQQPQDPVFHKLSSLEQAVQQLMGTQQQREAEFERQQDEAIQSEIQQFAADPANKYFENVRRDMGLLFQTEKADTIADAYQQACWLNPEIRELLIKDQFAKQQEEHQRTVNQKIRASGSLPPGAPLSDAGASPKNQSLRAALSQAFDAAGAQI